MARYRGNAAQSLHTRMRHVETVTDWHPPAPLAPTLCHPAPSFFRRKAELEEAGAKLALRIAVFRDEAATIERDLAYMMRASEP